MVLLFSKTINLNKTDHNIRTFQTGNAGTPLSLVELLKSKRSEIDKDSRERPFPIVNNTFFTHLSDGVTGEP